MHPKISAFCLGQLSNGSYERGIRINEFLVALPSYGGDYGGFVGAVASTRNDAPERLAMVMEFGDWFQKQHTDVVHSLVVECCLLRETYK